jgi:hypothetical protein
MEMQTFTFIEVTGLEHEWAVDIERCKQEMKPVVPKFILVSNGYDEKNFVYYIDQTLTDEKPEKIIDGVNGGIADNYKEVGFWIVKN